MALYISFENILACAGQSGRFAAMNDEKHQRDFWNRTIALFDRFGGPDNGLLLIADAYRKGYSDQAETPVQHKAA